MVDADDGLMRGITVLTMPIRHSSRIGIGGERPLSLRWRRLRRRPPNATGDQTGRQVPHYFTSSISFGRQVLSIQGSNGPYIRRSGNQLLSETV